MILKRTLAIFFCLSFIPCAHAQKAKPIDKKEIAEWFNKKPDCSEDSRFYFSKLEYFDFIGDGTRQAIVVASDCASGSGGPNVHSVISRDSDGELEELKIAEVDPKTYDTLFGNRNYTLSVENGSLIATFTDDSDRDAPLVIKYKWNGKEFAVASIQKTGVFPTSYDCTQPITEVENAICHVDILARLDVELNDVYKSLLSKVTGPEHEALREEQREWLAARDKSCAIYKGWVSCLSDYYERRIHELKARA
ncbi:MAG TPA: lysozyme inhibitor LprI family protein [Candidatus Binatus sp.]|jgi:uncharacterized protein YecT (DUF1311 family)|nr:lysozyme inhibitor LprI family protein [Candidatus Binatus sp.]